jgi:hypothetical protein
MADNRLLTGPPTRVGDIDRRHSRLAALRPVRDACYSDRPVNRERNNCGGGGNGNDMTEEEWLACEKSDLLLRHLKAIGATRWQRGQRRRKLRLLACAALGQARHLLRPEYGVRAIELAERYADGAAELTELQQLNQVIQAARLEIGTPQWAAEGCVWTLLIDNDLSAAELALEQAIWGLEREAAPTKPNLFRKSLRRAQMPLIRDIFGNPFRPVAFKPSWRTPDVLTLAGHIYHDRAFAELPDLAAALEQAGCDDPCILDHCRGPGPHVRGCWVADLVLGKE